MGRHSIVEVVAGALVLAVAFGFLAYAVAHSGRTVGSGYVLYAQFDNIAGLSIGGDVRLAGVKVGTVTDERLDPKNFEAIVAMTLEKAIRLPKDTSAAITSESLLGGKFVALSPGGDEAQLQPGQRIAVTQSSVSLEELLGKFIFSVTTLNDAKGGQSRPNKVDGTSNPSGASASGQSSDAEGGKSVPMAK